MDIHTHLKLKVYQGSPEDDSQIPSNPSQLFDVRIYVTILGLDCVFIYFMEGFRWIYMGFYTEIDIRYSHVKDIDFWGLHLFLMVNY